MNFITKETELQERLSNPRFQEYLNQREVATCMCGNRVGLEEDAWGLSVLHSGIIPRSANVHHLHQIFDENRKDKIICFGEGTIRDYLDQEHISFDQDFFDFVNMIRRHPLKKVDERWILT